MKAEFVKATGLAYELGKGVHAFDMDELVIFLASKITEGIGRRKLYCSWEIDGSLHSKQDETWTGPLPLFNRVCIHNDTSEMLVATWYLPEEITLGPGSTFTVEFGEYIFRIK